MVPLSTIDAITTPRLTLRPVHARDLPDLFEVNGDDQVTRFLPYATWRSPADGAAWLGRVEALEAAGGARQLVLETHAESRVVGTVLLFRHDPPSARLELGYVLGRRRWGQGLMREALAAACGHAFGALGLRRLEAEVHPDNVASWRLLERLGFTHEGTLRKRWVARGAAYDTRMYACLADEWPGHHADGQPQR